MKSFSFITGILLVFFITLSACGEADTERSAAGGSGQPPAGMGGLTQEQLEKGIGPIQQVSLGDVEAALAERGEEIFSMKCTACHKMEERYVGPPLGDVLERRTPEFIMNMMLNPAEMLEKHPEARAMLAQYMTPMPNQSLAEEEARAILEYLRQVHQEDEGEEDEHQEGDEHR